MSARTISKRTREQVAEPQRRSGVLCIGEAFVDLICERQIDDFAEAEVFVPHFGGTVANIALIAARAGARIALAGAIGEDSWGEWLRGQLHDADVDLRHFQAVAGTHTRIALVTIDAAGEPTYAVYGDPAGRIVQALDPVLDDAVADCGGLFISSHTLVNEDERALTMRARELALAAQRPIVFDPNLRFGRWSSRAQASASANACVPDALLVCANLEEAQVLTGERDFERAASALLKAGARNVVITLGARGAILRGKLKLDVPGRPARVISTVGAGDVVTGGLLARLESSDWYEPVIAAGLRDAVAAAAEACQRWGAVD